MTSPRFSNRTFGVEIECIAPRSYTPAAVAAAITQAGVFCTAQRYGHGVPRSWKIVSDRSVAGSGYGIEVVSPILRGEAGLAKLIKVMDALSATGCTVNVTCGLHVHVGAQDLSVKQIGNIAAAFLKYEDFFDFIQPPSRRACANAFIRSNRACFGGYDREATMRGIASVAAATGMYDLIGRFSGGTRYRKLNLAPFTRQGTIEFRQHSGTVDAAKAANWVRLLLAFVEGAKDMRQRDWNSERVNESVAFQRFFRRFNCKDLKAYFQTRRQELRAADGRRAARPATPLAA